MTAQVEARRITGPHLLGDRTGAALDVILGPHDDALPARWEAAARALLHEVGWPDETTAVRRFPGGANLFVSAPPDSLHAATDLAELAWAGVEDAGAADGIPRLVEAIARERNPALLALAEEAERRGFTFLHDDDGVSVGSGTGVQRWPCDGIPTPADVRWDAVHDIPTGLVTGSNGKTTTVRLAAAMVREAGGTPGYTSTDGVAVGRELIAPTDYSGPMGARLVLRDRRATTAVLETARGGILRRGLAVRRADAALITNIAEDHFGDFGIQDIGSLLAAKLVVTRVVRRNGAVIFNADDPLLRERGEALGRPVTWFSRSAVAGAPGAPSLVLDGHALVLSTGAERRTIATLDDVAAATGGTTRYNIENALGAAALALALGVDADAIAPALRNFDPAEDNPGRGTLLNVGGVRVLVDYGHNPHGLAALGEMADGIPASRRLVLLGQAGDREDAAIRALAETALTLRPDQVVLKEMGEYLRGRQPGEVRRLLRESLIRGGLPPDAIEETELETDAVRRALAWARPGDLLILLVHERRAEVLELLRTAGARRERLAPA